MSIAEHEKNEIKSKIKADKTRPSSGTSSVHPPVHRRADGVDMYGDA